MPDPERMVALGRIVNTHGIRGELRVLPYNPDTEALHAGTEVSLRHAGSTRSVRVESSRRHKNLILITIAGIASMTDAEALVGSEVEVAADALPAPSDGEAYHFQLIGLEVITTAGERVGVVEEIFTTAANDVCIVRAEGGREVLIPYVDNIIREVDLDNRKLVIEPIPGLLEN